MKCIEAVFQVTTPMFMSGSDQSVAEFRVPSLLGALRFWYRATAPTRLIQDTTALNRVEAELFGSSDIDLGQAAFLTRADTKGISFARCNKQFWDKPGCGYLGFGILGRVQERGYISPGSTIKIRFVMRLKHRKDGSGYYPDHAGLIKSIKAVTLFGGLGARSRRGFGSLSLVSLQDETGQSLWKKPENQEQLRDAIRNLLTGIGVDDLENNPQYTAFSKESRVIISGSHKDPLLLLDEIGKEMVRYRSYGRGQDGRHLLMIRDATGKSEKAQQNFSDDHDLVLNASLTNKPVHHPRRVAFGLPHNYFFSTGNKKKVDIAGAKHDRRGSPLIIHIHSLGAENAAVLTYLPAQFLPKDDQIVIKGVGEFPVQCQVDSRVIPVFLERFKDRLEVWP